MVSLANSKDIVATTISVIDKHKGDWFEGIVFINIRCYITKIVGLPIDTLNSLPKLAEAINSDATFFDTGMSASSLKSDLTCVTILCDSINTFKQYDTIYVATVKCLTKANDFNTY